MVRRRYVVAFTLIMAAMLAWAPGSVAAGHALVVGSSHTTNSDFQNAQTLTNFTVASDTVSLPSDSVVTDGFEDNDLSEYTFHGTDTGGWGTTTAAKNGSYAGEYVGNGNGNWEFARHNSDHSTTKNATISGWVYTDSSSFAGFRASSSSTGIDGVEARYRASDGDFVLYDGESGANLDSQNTALSGWAYIALEYDPTTGDTTAWIDDDTDYRTNPIATLTGSVSNDGDTGWGPMAFDAASTDVRYDDITYGSQGDDPSTAQYISANHSVSQAEEVWTNVTLTNGTFTVAAEAWDPSAGQWQEVNSASYSSTGNYTLDVSGTSYDTWRVNVTFEKTGTDPTAKLHDEGVLFYSSSPSGSTLSPSDGAELSSSSVDFSVDVTDADFGTKQGDTVDATLQLKAPGASSFTDYGSTSTASNGTVTVTESLSEGGDWEYRFKLTDSYGESTTTSTQTVTVPADLRIYNESNPTQLVDSASVELRFYFESGGTDTIVTRTTSNGTIDMSGLPADEPFVVVAEAENYSSRRIFVPSLYEAQRVYLLPESADASDIVFSIEDYTGSYPQDVSVLEVQRAITRDYDGDGTNETEWETVLGDYFGANGQFPGVLETGVRYRLRLRNTESGDTRVLGSFTPLGSQTQTVTVSPDGGIVDLEQAPTVAFQPDIPQLPALNGTDVSVVVDNRSSTLASWNVSVVHVNTTSGVNTTLYSASSTDPSGGERNTTLDLSGDVGRIVVSVSWTTDAGLSDTVVESYSINEVFTDYRSGSLLHIVSQDLPALIPDADWSAFAAMFAILSTLFFTAGVAYYVEASSELLGLFAVAMLAAWGTLGFIDYNIVYVAGIAWVGLATLRRGL